VRGTRCACTLSLWRAANADMSRTLNVHRMTSDWKEGTGLYDCTGDGASWRETEGGVSDAMPLLGRRLYQRSRLNGVLG